MAIPTRTARPGTYFVTAATHNRRRLFQVPHNAELLLDTLQHYRREGQYRLHAFVVMPDHIHLLLTRRPSPSSERCNSSKAAFPPPRLPPTRLQRSFTDHRIRDRADFDLRRNYIHQNPASPASPPPPKPTHTPPLAFPAERRSIVIYSIHEPRPRPRNRTAHPA